MKSHKALNVGLHTVPTDAEGLASSTAENRLESVPAELRNSIFNQALVEQHPIDVSGRWPGLTGTCKQFREDALAIYFGNNTFAARIHDLDDRAVIAWLRKISTIGRQYTSTIASVSIIPEGQLTHVTQRSKGELSPCYPNFEFWDEVIANISHAGLMTNQVSWTSSLLASIKTIGWATSSRSAFPMQLAMESTLLHDAILPALLRRWNIYDIENPPAKLMSSLVESYGAQVQSWIEDSRSDAGGCSLDALLEDTPWWRTPVELDLGWKERHRQYRKNQQVIKEQEPAAKLPQEGTEEEQKIMAASDLLSLFYRTEGI